MELDELKRLKDESGLTVQQISNLTNIPAPTLNKIFSGQTENPGFDTVAKLIVTLGGSLDKIAGIGTKEEEMSAITAIREIYDKQIAALMYDKKILFIFVAALLAFVLGLFAFDVVNGSVGWLRY